MNLNITIDKPEFDKHSEKSTTNNYDWKRCVIVQFPNCEFKWIPTYKQLTEIYQKLCEAEQINKEQVKQNGNR